MIAPDKTKHVLAGFGITLLVGFSLGALVFGYCAGLLAGLGKEAFDYIQNRRRIKRGLPPEHSVEAMDVLYTLVGVAIGIGALLLLQVR